MLPVVFQLGESPHPQDFAEIVLVDFVAFPQFRVRIAPCEFVVLVVGASQQIRNLVVVIAFIITPVDTDRQFERFRQFVRIGGQQPVPIVRVGSHREDGVRTVVGVFVVFHHRQVVDQSVRGQRSVFVGPSGLIIVSQAVGVFAVHFSASSRRIGDINGGRQRGFAVDLPEMVQRDLRLVVFVIARIGRNDLSVDITVTGIHPDAVFMEVVIFDRLFVAAPVMPLRRAEGRQRQDVVASEFFRNVRKIAPSFEIRSFYVSVARRAGSHDREGPPFRKQTRREVEAHFLVTVVPDAVIHGTLPVDFGALGDDIDRPADRKETQFGEPDTALYLDAVRNVGQSRPVRPIDASVLHAVDRDAVDQHGDVFRTEAAQHQPRIAEASSLLGRINRRRGFHDFGKFLIAQFGRDVFRADRRQYDRLDAFVMSVGSHYFHLFQSDGQGVRIFRNILGAYGRYAGHAEEREQEFFHSQECVSTIGANLETFSDLLCLFVFPACQYFIR